MEFSDWMQFIVAILSGLAAAIPLVVELVTWADAGAGVACMPLA